MSVAEPEQERARARRLLPALEFSDARFGISQYEAFRCEILERELRAGGHIAEFGQTILPVVPVGGHHVRTVDVLGLRSRPGDPGVSHLDDFRGPPRLARRLLI